MLLSVFLGKVCCFRVRHLFLKHTQSVKIKTTVVMATRPPTAEPTTRGVLESLLVDCLVCGDVGVPDGKDDAELRDTEL